MWRLAWSQLRFRTVRVVALLAGMLLATTAFTVLTAASRTSQLRTIGSVSAHFVPAYDILVRPPGARTALEKQTDTVQPNFLSGVYGGITMAQYRAIRKIPGVQVAAPIAMVGYSLLVSNLSWPLPAADYSKRGRQLYRVSTTWFSVAGHSRIKQQASYIYVTPNPARNDNLSGMTSEVLPGGRTVNVCPGQYVTPHESPFGAEAQSSCLGWSKVNGLGPGSGSDKPVNPGFYVTWTLPVLLAAIDPDAEAKLDGLNRAVIAGHYLNENAHDGPPTAVGSSLLPVLASSNIGMDENAETTLQLLATPKMPPDMTVSWRNAEAAVRGRTLLTKWSTAQDGYRQLLAWMRPNSSTQVIPPALWTVGPTSYHRTAAGALAPLLVHNPPSVWYVGGSPGIALDNSDNQYRKIADHAAGPSGWSGTSPFLSLVGIFNPTRIESFDPLSEVPLGPYQSVAASPANAASRQALRGGYLQPNQNLGGYVSEPVNLVTTLSALPALLDSNYFGRRMDGRDPISVIRVRVAGVTGPNAESLARIREVAQQIEQRTHLVVDIVTGSSPSPTTIDLPAGKFGQPALQLTEGWVKKGVAVAILTAVDKNSVVLFTLILIVCILFVANSASAAIRGRRHELGVLACLGWTSPRLFTTVLGELAAIGLTAGILGAAAALPLSSALGLHASAGRAALAVPIAVGVAVIAGLVPAWLAARAEPIASVRPPVLAVRRPYQPDGLMALAAVNVLRTPGRAIVGAISLAVGITALTMLTGITFAFHGVLVGSLLGDAVAVQVRGVDYVAVIATVALGVLAVSDVIFLNIRERASELATIRTFGWRESALGRLVVTEGAIIGLTGSLAGAALGLAGAARFAGQLPAALILVAIGAVAAGTLITALAALLPAQALRRLPVAQTLAEE